MKRRKAVSVLLVMAMAASMLTGCGGGVYRIFCSTWFRDQ